MRLIEAALGYARRGRRVFPLAGKVPRTRRGLHDATTDADVIRQWWENWPTAGIGLPMGDGLIALDVDGDDGRASLAQLVEEHGPLPDTLANETSRGAHLIFRVAADRQIRNRAGVQPGLDVRSAGGYIVAPPSVHPSGWVYRWMHAPIADAPAWLLDVLDPPRNVETSAPARALDLPTERRLQRARAYLAKLPAGISGSGGHAATFRAALALVRGFALDRDEALALLVEDFNPRCVPPWSRRDLVHKVESAAAAASSKAPPLGYLLDAGPGPRRRAA